MKLSRILSVAVAFIGITILWCARLEAQTFSRLAALESRANENDTNSLTYGSLVEDNGSGNIALSTAGAWVKWVTGGIAVTNNILGTGGTNLITLVAGYYQMDASLYGVTSAASTNRLKGAIFTNGVRVANYDGRATAPNAEVTTIGLQIVGTPIYLPVGAVIDVRLANTNGNVTTVNFTNQHAHLNARLIGQ